MHTKREFFPKCKLSRTEMQAMRDEGYNYTQIAEAAGVSKQRIFQLIGGEQRNRTPKPLTETECVYPNLRKWMNENHVSRGELTRRLYNGTTPPRACERVNKFLNGTVNHIINRQFLDSILKITGLTYEQLFAEN